MALQQNEPEVQCVALSAVENKQYIMELHCNEAWQELYCGSIKMLFSSSPQIVSTLTVTLLQSPHAQQALGILACSRLLLPSLFRS